MADQYQKFPSREDWRDWKLTEYVKSVSPKGILIIPFVTILAWTGLVSSFINIVLAVDMIFLPLTLIFKMPLSLIPLGLGLVALLTNVGWFIYSFCLWRSLNSLHDTMGMRRIIKIGCYIVGALELALCVISMLFQIAMVLAVLLSGGITILILLIPIIINGVAIGLISGMIHGVRKFIPNLVNFYIIFKGVIFAIYALLTFVQLIVGFAKYENLGFLWLTAPNEFLFWGFFYIYSTCFSVAHYNIMLHRPREEGGMIHSPPQPSGNANCNENANEENNPPVYPQIENV